MQRLIPLNNENLSTLIRENMGELKSHSDTDHELDLSKEFRFKHYPVILLILNNALKELVSTVSPTPDKEYKETDQRGFLYLYDGKVPNYMQDGIKWKKTRMSVKLIVHSKDKGIYKLKNHKTDEGVAVMRRQTWQGNGWRKNEYKLINRETYYKPESDGTFSMNECQRLQDFPVLVHYFRKNDNLRDDFAGRKRKVKTSDSEEISNDNNFVERSDPLLPPLLFPGTLPTSPTNPFLPSSPSSFFDLKDDFTFSSDILKDEIPTPPTKVPRSALVSIATPTPTANIKSFAPESGPADDNTKVIVVVEGFIESPNMIYSCMMDGLELPAKLLQPGVLELEVGPHEAGVVQMWIMGRPFGGNVQYSNTVFFYYTPSDEVGKLSLAFSNLSSNSSFVREIIRHFRHTVKELDISNNELEHVDFLEDLGQLRTLILDNNRITSSSRLPHLPKLIALYVNSNMITELEPFLDRLSECFPSLQYLSLLGNEACPYLSQQAHHYYNYRIYVISKLRKLSQLDSSPVAPEEWRHAACIIPSDDLSIKQEPLF